MIVFGIDPGIGITGCATIKQLQGKVSLLNSTGIKTPTNLPIAKRLTIIYQEIINYIKETRPEVAALETLFFSKNVTTAFAVGQARGVVQLALTQENIPIVEYNPMQVKIALTGFGRAPKGQIQKMVAKVLGLSKTLTPDDLADAAAIALTHCFSYKLKNSIK